VSKYAANTSHAFVKLPSNVLYTYNLWDTFYTAKLAGALHQEMLLPKFGKQAEYFREWVEPLQRAVLSMQRHGLWLNKGVLADYRTSVRKELRETDTFIKGCADEAGFKYTEKFPNSDIQTGKFLFDTLGLKPHKKTPTGRPSVDQDALTRVLRYFRKKDEPHRDLIYALFHRSRLQTILERYITRLEPDPDGRIRARVKITGTKTFRYAYADPALQQFPNEVRRIFWAREGYRYVAVDKSQLEARLLAILSGDTPSLDTFATGGDVHTQNVWDLFGLDEEAWLGMAPQLRKAHRVYAKGFLYRISYGGEGSTDKSKVFCPCPKCAHRNPPTLALKRQEILATEERWFKKHPAVRAFHRDLLREVQRKGYYESPLGVRRFIAQPWGAELERELKNLPMQMNAALLMNRAQVILNEPPYPAPICLQMHDEFLAEVPEEDVELWAEKIKRVMERPVEELGGAVFPTEVKVGRNWADQGPDNPEGLQELSAPR
jgi:DNA polymerase-1